MGMLENIKTGKIKKPYLILMQGVDGVGKSTWASEAPSPIFLGNEDGTNYLDVARMPTPKTFKDVMQGISELTEGKHEYKTLVIDSLDWMETLAWAHVCSENNWKNIEDPGYGKGYTIVLDTWKKMITALAMLREKRGMNIILIAHTLVKPFNDPNLPAPLRQIHYQNARQSSGTFSRVC